MNYVPFYSGNNQFDAFRASGIPLIGHAILFEHDNFKGAHLHVFNGVDSLSQYGFNDIVSSFVVLSGRWQFFRDDQFQFPYEGVFGPGVYSWVENYGIKNDDLSSLRCV
ncbi:MULTISPECIES: beta/gamma crystallin-related protein [Clostridium]|uniref:Beta/gamma crystallin family protein n=1 Tax=Clostridium cibarium TaxID=2762247 RepID=A0ABR8PTE6_9CLOT|nr:MULTISPECIES: beta/gamma crystallin-related protein [Clostridium]MBD7911456.1 beta/gamma crystallin family protein [Clostridium cibarium]